MAQDIFGLKGKHAIVWGGGLGMGERTAIRLSEAGALVSVIDLEQIGRASCRERVLVQV